MQMTLCPLASGSSGNCLFLSCGGTKLLIDAGVSAARICGALCEIGVDIEEIDAVLVTHEHTDHVRGLGVLCRRYGLPVYANEGTWNGILLKESGIPATCRHTFYTDEDFYIGGIDVRPFAIPHDAMEPVGFAFSCRGMRCGVATDIGHIVEDGWLRAVSGCQLLVLEANHDVEMVERGPYPQRLKKRILSRHGHLNNEDSAKALAELCRRGAKAVFLAHLSAENNLPELAYNTVCASLAGAGLKVGSDVNLFVARRDRVSDMVVLSSEQTEAQRMEGEE